LFEPLFKRYGIVAHGSHTQRMPLGDLVDAAAIKAANPDFDRLDVAEVVRFAREIEPGHGILTPGSESGEAWVGIVRGPCTLAATDDPDPLRVTYWMSRACEWQDKSIYLSGDLGHWLANPAGTVSRKGTVFAVPTGIAMKMESLR